MEYDTSRILCYACTHLPYQHIDTIPFLQYVRDIVRPTLWINGGDEADKHAMNYHEHDPDLPSAGDEYRLAYKYMQEFFILSSGVPTLVLFSNHGAMVYRKAKTHGIPKHFIKPYEEIWDSPPDWRWVTRATLTLPDGTRCRFAHQLSANVLAASQAYGMSAVGAHHHNQLGVRCWNNGDNQLFGANMGCLADQQSLAMAYSNTNIKESSLGCLAIINSEPVIFQMKLDKDKRWVGRVK